MSKFLAGTGVIVAVSGTISILVGQAIRADIEGNARPIREDVSLIESVVEDIREQNPSLVVEQPEVLSRYRNELERYEKKVESAENISVYGGYISGTGLVLGGIGLLNRRRQYRKEREKAIDETLSIIRNSSYKN